MLFSTLQNTTNTGIDSLFSSNFGKETDVIFLTCNELSNAKEALINSVSCKLGIS